MGSSSSAPSPALHKAVDVPNLKIAIIGDPEVGKTSILSRYIRNQFSPVYIPTHKAAIENVVRKFNVPGHAKVPITFWDIPGHEDLPLHSSYFTDLDAVIVVVDLSVPASLESAVVWRQTVLSSATFTSSSKLDEEKDKEARDSINQSKKVEDIPFLLLGNKLDLCLEKGGGDVEETHDENLVVSNKVQQLEEVAGRGFTGR
ncbi:hypothetical protein EGW08_001860 [Elysia chlorotica]|uniref:Tr-type G domain-containing protein n=1 Tax=Elysia chlorotica TaxID=188477 RepID=A0A3S1A046_ELYCH|nr:hypothetical protein EGW08_001860 [Elysia chlorotica]